jgi:hypothetical protein
MTKGAITGSDLTCWANHLHAWGKVIEDLAPTVDALPTAEIEIRAGEAWDRLRGDAERLIKSIGDGIVDAKLQTISTNAEPRKAQPRGKARATNKVQVKRQD